MSAQQLLNELAAAGVYLYVDGDRLRYRARSGEYSEEMRGRVAEHRGALIALLTSVPEEDTGSADTAPTTASTMLPPFDPAATTPSAHWRAMGAVDPAIGLVGLVGPTVAGDMLAAARRWEATSGAQRDELAREYATIWSRAKDLRRAKGRLHEPLR